MEDKLELKNLAPYLPYKLKCTNSKESYLQTGEDRTGILEQLSIQDEDSIIMGENGYFIVDVSEITPILRPLYDIEKEISINGEKFIPRQRFIEKTKPKNMIGHDKSIDRHIDSQLSVLEEPKGYDNLKHWMYQDLIKWHFDVFGLIKKGLAIDINTIKS